jgi:hypothetical protein
MLEMRNLGALDRAARIAIGGGLLALVYKMDRFDPWTLGGTVVGAALLMTGLVGSCMLYSLLGLRTSGSAGGIR